MTLCRHCGRPIVNENGTWIDPEATGDDAVWRETCEAHDTFVAEHEPKRTPRDLITELSAIVESPEDYKWLRRIVFEIIEDVLDSVRLALEPFPEQVLATVTDYVINNYGEDD